MDKLPTAFNAMASYRQFVVYRITPSKTRPGKTDKITIDPVTNLNASQKDQKIWMDAETAINTAKSFGDGYGVGFVLTENDPFFLLDIDVCWDGQSWSQEAIALCQEFNGAAIEISSSNRGLHIIGSGSASAPPHMCNPADNNLEFYTSNRFIALTGTQAQGDAGYDCSHLLSKLVDTYFKKQIHETSSFGWTTEPCAEWSGPIDDDELIARMLQSKSSGSAWGRHSFADLWNNNEAVLAVAYPPNGADTYDRSTADMALAQHLAFWTGKNCERMRGLMLKSGLVREKWERSKYLEDTILKAASRQLDTLKDVRKNNTKQIIAQGIMGHEEQNSLFDGCVYVLNQNRILIPGGYLISQEQFNVMYGGYRFVTEIGNTKTTTKAWEAFTQTQFCKRPKVHGVMFRPDLKPGEIFNLNGEDFANYYWPVQTPSIAGDASRFQRHVELLVGDTDDAQILICYLAALIQHKGIKFKWCPVIQGAEGNGKTFFSKCIAYAIGQRYTYFPKARDLAEKFNDWLDGKMFYGVEDIYTENKREIIEVLKPMITEESLDIEGKNKQKYMGHICGNFLINTNHVDGVQKTENNRRFAPFYTKQQSYEDIKRDGLTEQYFYELYNWFNNENGGAIINHFLSNYKIPDEYNPATHCQRAPKTSSTDAAISKSRGRVEQEILEAVAQGRPGFRGGWISSKWLDLFLKEIGAAKMVPPNKRRELLASLGYVAHPGLTQGRVTSTISFDGIKSILFIAKEHNSRSLKSSQDISDKYVNDQQP